MRKVLLLAVMALVCALPAMAIFDKYTISREELPEAAREMLSEYFPKAKISMIKIDKHLLKKTDYDVKLVNGTKIEFSNAGKWTSVDCGKRAVPEGIVPKSISRYIVKNRTDEKIVSIRKKSTSYEVGVSGGETLKFNLLGQFKGVIPQGDADPQDDDVSNDGNADDVMTDDDVLTRQEP